MSLPLPNPPPLGFPLKLTYGLGSVAYGVAAGALSASVLVYYFNQVMHIPAVWGGAAILVSLSADVILDPLIGHGSDNFRSRIGRRHPFMYASALPVAVFFYFLWHAPRGLEGTSALVFAMVMLIGVRVSVASYEIPSTALTPELAPDYHQRTGLLAYRWFFSMAAIPEAAVYRASIVILLKLGQSQGAQAHLFGYRLTAALTLPTLSKRVSLQSNGSWPRRVVHWIFQWSRH